MKWQALLSFFRGVCFVYSFLFGSRPSSPTLDPEPATFCTPPPRKKSGIWIFWVIYGESLREEKWVSMCSFFLWGVILEKAQIYRSEALVLEGEWFMNLFFVFSYYLVAVLSRFLFFLPFRVKVITLCAIFKLYSKILIIIGTLSLELCCCYNYFYYCLNVW